MFYAVRNYARKGKSKEVHLITHTTVTQTLSKGRAFAVGRNHLVIGISCVK